LRQSGYLNAKSGSDEVSPPISDDNDNNVEIQNYVRNTENVGVTSNNFDPKVGINRIGINDNFNTQGNLMNNQESNNYRGSNYIGGQANYGKKNIDVNLNTPISYSYNANENANADFRPPAAYGYSSNNNVNVNINANNKVENPITAGYGYNPDVDVNIEPPALCKYIIF